MHRLSRFKFFWFSNYYYCVVSLKKISTVLIKGQNSWSQEHSSHTYFFWMQDQLKHLRSSDIQVHYSCNDAVLLMYVYLWHTFYLLHPSFQMPWVPQWTFQPSTRMKASRLMCWCCVIVRRRTEHISNIRKGICWCCCHCLHSRSQVDFFMKQHR